MFLEWSFSFTPNTRLLSSSSLTSQLIVNTTTLTFSRLSGQDVLPLISRLSISPVGNAFNRTTVTCTNVDSSEASSTVINIEKEDVFERVVNLSITSEESEVGSVTVILEWTLEPASYFYFYNISIIPQLNLTFVEGTRVMLMVPYNSLYNVTVVAEHRCGQNNITAFKHLLYVECKNPSPDIDHSVKVMGYSELEPSVIGTTVSLYCPVGMVLNGPNMSTCIEDGIWAPDIREVTCMATCSQPLRLSGSRIIPYTVEEGTVVDQYSFLNVYQLGHQSHLTKVNLSIICNSQGNWELTSAENTNSKNQGNHSDDISRLSQDAKFAVGSSVTVFIVSSVLFFIGGFACGRFCHKQKHLVDHEPVPPQEQTTIPLYDNILPQDSCNELELETNTAYGPALAKPQTP